VVVQNHRGREVDGLPLLVRGDRHGLCCGQPKLCQPRPPTTTHHRLAVHRFAVPNDHCRHRTFPHGFVDRWHAKRKTRAAGRRRRNAHAHAGPNSRPYLPGSQCRVDIAAEFTTHGFLGWLARTVILARVLRDGRHLLDDLTHYVETGPPSPKKLSRQRHCPHPSQQPLPGTVDVQGRQPAPTVV
jgi:hypothetical protein